MKILIDISQIVYGTGVSVYTKNLVRNLYSIDKENKYLLFAGSLRQRKSFSEFNAKVYPFPPTVADIFWNRFHTLPIEVFTGPVDVYHSSDWAQAPSRAFKVTTVHDLAPILFPKETDPKVVAVHNRRLEIVKKEIDKVIVPSLATKNDLINFGIKDEKIVVIPEAATISDKKPTENVIQQTLSKFGINEPFLLAVGSNPRKNIKNIIKAVKDKYKLVVVGHNTTGIESRQNIIFTGHVSDEDLTNLFYSAEALIYVSLYEGFGIPILNAFTAGCPVVTSNISSMPEVSGDAAVLVNPNDPKEVFRGVEKLQNNRERYIKAGLKRVKLYNWQTMAKQTLEIYMESQK